MKKIKFRYQKTEGGVKKSVLKFRDYYDDEIEDDELDSGHRRKKDEGKRMHRKRAMKDGFMENDN